jgi:FkbM family methyltransferase
LVSELSGALPRPVYDPVGQQNLPHQGLQITFMVGLLLRKPDFSALQGKTLSEVASQADKLANGGIEDKLHAHVLLSSILEQLPPSESGALAPLTGKLWSLEKSLHWHERYFSQAGQHKRIKDAFFKNCRNGFFLEIGAYDGVTGSNCLHFEKFMGWDGIAVEPSRTQFGLLQKNRTRQTINKAVGFADDTVEFIEVVEGLMQMSGVDSKEFAGTKYFVENDKTSRTVSYQIETVGVMEMLDGRSEVDFMSLDIEGAELQVLESIDFDALRIRVIAVENNAAGSPKYRRFFDKVGYSYYDTVGYDEIYFHPGSVDFTRT